MAAYCSLSQRSSHLKNFVPGLLEESSGRAPLSSVWVQVGNRNQLGNALPLKGCQRWDAHRPFQKHYVRSWRQKGNHFSVSPVGESILHFIKLKIREQGISLSATAPLYFTTSPKSISHFLSLLLPFADNFKIGNSVYTNIHKTQLVEVGCKQEKGGKKGENPRL